MPPRLWIGPGIGALLIGCSNGLGWGEWPSSFHDTANSGTSSTLRGPANKGLCAVWVMEGRNLVPAVTFPSPGILSSDGDTLFFGGYVGACRLVMPLPIHDAHPLRLATTTKSTPRMVRTSQASVFPSPYLAILVCADSTANAERELAWLDVPCEGPEAGFLLSCSLSTHPRL